MTEPARHDPSAMRRLWRPIALVAGICALAGLVVTLAATRPAPTPPLGDPIVVTGVGAATQAAQTRPNRRTDAGRGGAGAPRTVGTDGESSGGRPAARPTPVRTATPARITRSPGARPVAYPPAPSAGEGDDDERDAVHDDSEDDGGESAPADDD